MLAALVAVVTALLLTTTGLALGATLRVRSLAELLLAAYVLAFAEVVALTLLLSPFDGIRRPALLAGLAVVCALAVGLWWRSGRPVAATGALRAAGRVLREWPPLVVLATAVSLAFAYVIALVVGTPPNAWDTLSYHLARAALWRQDGAAGYIDNAYDGRLNGNPPNGELALTFVLELTRDERFAGFAQLLGALALATGVFALARRLGLSRPEAAFGGLLFLTLPLVVLQASTALNDLVLAALLLAATVFLLGDSRQSLGLASLATALAVGTKVTAAYGVVILLLVAVVASPRDARPGRVVAIGLGALAGSYWYVLNLAKTGRALGPHYGTDLIALFEPRENLLSALARILDTLELPGTEGSGGFSNSDALLYVVVAAVLLSTLVVIALTTGRVRLSVALTAGWLALLPLSVPPLGYVYWRAFAKLHDVLGGPEGELPVGEWPRQTTASETISWFGPLALFLLVGVAVASVVLHRRGSWSGLAVALAVAPLLWLVLVSASIEYDVWQGRFFVFPVALSAALWGVVLRTPAVAWAAVAIGATTVALSLVNSLEKPSGVQLFADREIESVWGRERWEVQSLTRAEIAPVLRFLEEEVPTDAAIALALNGDEWGYPAFGRHLERPVELVPLRSTGRGVAAGWLLLGPARPGALDPVCWRPVVDTPSGWAVLRAQPGCGP
jgi:hypothetical protein